MVAWLLPAALSAAGMVGGALGSRGRPPIDPRMLAMLFGPNALASDTQTLFQTLSNSPAFQALMSSASATGTQAGNATRAAFARAGLSNSGVGALGGAVSRGFGQNLRLRARGDLWNTALSTAGQNLAARMGLWGSSQLAYQQTPTLAQSIGAGLESGAAMGLSAWGANRAAKAAAAPSPATNVVTAPMRRVGPSSTSPFENQFRISYR